MYKTKISLSIVVGLIVATAVVLPAHAQRVHLQQPISLRTCTLTAIADENGPQYGLPNGCGKILANIGRGQTEEHQAYSQLSVGGDAYLSKLFYGVDESVFIDTRAGAQPADGYMLLTELGSVYTFYLRGDDRRGVPRSLEFVYVAPDKVALRFLPGGSTAWLPFDTRTEVDISHDGNTDAVFRLVNSRDDGTVLLHVSFVRYVPDGPAMNQTMPIVAAALLTFGGIVLLQEYLSSYLLRHRMPGRDWWVEHPHDPFA